MIEQVLFFALGFLVMGLLALLFLPFYWQRAVHLSTRRLEALMPLTMPEIAAERDSLRAEHAVHTRRIEQQAEAAHLARAQDQIELGRRAGQISTLGADLATRNARLAELELAFGAAKRAQAEAEATVGAAQVEIHDSNGLTAKSRAEYQELAYAHQDLMQHADSQRTTIAALETRAASLDIRLEDAVRAIENVQTARAQGEEEAKKTQADLAAMQANLQNLQKLHAQALEEIAQRKQQLETAQANVLVYAEQVVAAKSSHAEQAEQARDLSAQLEKAEARGKELRANLQRQVEMARASDASLAKRIDTLRGENTALKDQLAAVNTRLTEAELLARRTNADTGSSAANAEEMASLRQAVSDIGREMIRLNILLKKTSTEDLPVHERLRQLQAQLAKDVLIN